MRKLDINISEVKKLVELVESHNLEELTVEEGDLSITIKGKTAQVAAPVVVHTGQGAVQAEPVHEEEHEEAVEVEEEAIAGNLAEIVAPLVGVFYRAPAPDAPNFCEIGDKVEVGSEVGLIEAMKVFSPIPSEVAGEIVEIVATNGKLVQQSEVLYRVIISEEQG